MNDTKLSLSQVADAVEVRPSTIKYYTELGLLPYQSNGAGLRNYYAAEAVQQTIDIINQLKADGKTIDEIVDHFKTKGLLND